MSASSKKKIRKEQEASAMTERQKQELREAKQSKRLTAIFSIVMILIVVSFIATMSVNIVNSSGLIEKNTIVATVGEHKLNTVAMNYYFYDAVSTTYNNLYETYGDYASSFLLYSGLDLSKPLDEQIKDKETGETWADHFLNEAINNAKAEYALYDKALADGFQPTEDDLAGIEQTLQYVNLYASVYGTSANKYLSSMYGAGSTEASYRDYATVGATARAYYAAHQDSLNYTEDDFRAHDADIYNQYSAYTYNSYTVNYTSFLEGGTTDEKGNTTYSDEEKDAARKKAEEASLSLGSVTSVTELDAAIAALSYNADKEEKPTSTASTDVLYSNLNEDYAEWLSDSSRKDGDVKVFPNTTTTTDEDGNESEIINSYYVLMFRSRNDNLEKLDNVRHILISYEGGTKDENGNTTYSDEEKAAARKKADDLLAKWKEGEATEESFIALVADNTGDTGSKETGGLIEDIHRDSSLVTNFRAWAIDPERKVGDTGVVESDYGYHVMYYVGEDELTYRDYLINNDLVSDAMEEWYDSIVDPVTVTEGNSNRINKDLIFKASNS